MIHVALFRPSPASAKALSFLALALLLEGCMAQTGVTVRRNGAEQTAVDPGQLRSGFPLQLAPYDRVRVRVLPLSDLAQSPVFEPDDIAAYHFTLSSDEYHVMRGDDLAIHFGAEPKLDATVTVRPDGRVTLQNVAEIVAAGKTPSELSSEIDRAYRDRLTQPAASVTVAKSNLSLAELSGESVVQSDGTISVPKIGGFKAGGQTSGQLAQTLSEAASKLFGNTLTAEVTRSKSVPTVTMENRRLIGYDSIVSIAVDQRILLPEIGYISTQGKTVAALQQDLDETVKARYRNPLAVQVTLEASESRVVYVDGEVARPGAYPVTNSLTLLKALSLAGGVIETGSMKEIILIHRNETNDVFVYLTNLHEFIKKGIGGNDLAIAPQDIIVVPKTSVAKANQWVEQYITRMLPFSRSVSYSYNRIPNNNQIPPPAPSP